MGAAPLKQKQGEAFILSIHNSKSGIGDFIGVILMFFSPSGKPVFHPYNTISCFKYHEIAFVEI